MPNSNSQHVHPATSGQLGVIQRIEHWASTTPAKTALRFASTDMSYASLHEKIVLYATALERDGVGAGSVVSVALERSADMLVLLLAIWARRAAYVPIDPAYPAERRQQIVDHAQAGFFIAERAVDTAISHSIPFDRIRHCADLNRDAVLPQTDDVANDLAYVIYTSGSTGKPKGVAISQKNLRNFLTSMALSPGMESDDILLAVTTICFDIHILELFLPLHVGATVLIASSEECRSSAQLAHLIDANNVSYFQATPASWRMLLSGDWRPQRPLKALVGGEALPSDLLPLIFPIARELWNMYGPTETTVWSTHARIESENGPIHIGSPIHNTELYVVDVNNRPVKSGQSGELLIGGTGVALGYYHDEALSRERFVTLKHLSSDRLYRTGDLVRFRKDGYLEYINRIDNQIKIRGFRIEPGDIETCANAYPAVRQSCVVASEFALGDQRLVCFYIGTAVDEHEFREYFAQKLPSHMIPQHFIYLNEFPKTDNLKINRKELVNIAPGLCKSATATTHSAARNNIDRCIVRVWESQLNRAGIGIDDDFFAMGGHSLLALKVMEEMNRASGLNFQAERIFTEPTIRQLVDSVGSVQQAATTASKLNTADSGTPIFCLCGVQIYSDLARAFEGEHPVYAVFGQQEIAMLKDPDNKHISFDSEHFAQSYLDAIRRQYPAGKLILAGFSFGGILAVDLAHRLKKLGYEIGPVLLIDSYTRYCLYRSASKIVRDSLTNLHNHGVAHVARDLLYRTKKKLGRRRQVATQKEREEVFDLAASAFRPTSETYTGDAILLKAQFTDFGFGMRARHDYDWGSRIRGELRIFEYPYDHTSLMQTRGASSMHADVQHYLD